jgi:hypothetical protein
MSPGGFCLRERSCCDGMLIVVEELMKKTWLRVLLTIIIIILIIAGIRMIKSLDKHAPNESQKGNPFRQN